MDRWNIRCDNNLYTNAGFVGDFKSDYLFFIIFWVLDGNVCSRKVNYVDASEELILKRMVGVMIISRVLCFKFMNM